MKVKCKKPKKYIISSIRFHTYMHAYICVCMWMCKRASFLYFYGVFVCFSSISFVSLSVCLCRSVCPSVRLSVCLYLFICLVVYFLFVFYCCLFVCLLVILPFVNLSFACWYIRLFVYLLFLFVFLLY